MSRKLAGTPLILEYTKAAQKELRKLSIEDSERIQVALQSVALTGEGQIKPLEGYQDVFRLEVADTRAEFWVIKTASLMQVIRVFYRQEGYSTKGRKRRG